MRVEIVNTLEAAIESKNMTAVQAAFAVFKEEFHRTSIEPLEDDDYWEESSSHWDESWEASDSCE